MSEKYVLPPALLIPKQKMHWAVKALLGVGGLLAVQLAVVGLIAVKRDRDASAKLAELEAQRQAAVLAAAKPAEPARAAAPPAAQNPPKPVAAEAPAAKTQASVQSTKASRAHGRSSRSHHARGGSSHDRKLLAALNGSKAPKPAAASAPASRRSNEAIDEILKNFK